MLQEELKPTFGLEVKVSANTEDEAKYDGHTIFGSKTGSLGQSCGYDRHNLGFELAQCIDNSAHMREVQAQSHRKRCPVK